MILSLLALSLTAASPAQAEEVAKKDAKETFREPGRIGILGAITEDLWKGGIIFEHEYFEAQVLFHAAFQDADNRETHYIFKGGGRVALGSLNYLALGAEYRAHFGARSAGVDTGKAFEAGPYISLQRYFAATPVMLNLWVNPVLYEHTVGLDENGQNTSQNGLKVLQSGGFGVAYLF